MDRLRAVCERYRSPPISPPSILPTHYTVLGRALLGDGDSCCVVSSLTLSAGGTSCSVRESQKGSVLMLSHGGTCAIVWEQSRPSHVCTPNVRARLLVLVPHDPEHVAATGPTGHLFHALTGEAAPECGFCGLFCYVPSADGGWKALLAGDHE